MQVQLAHQTAGILPQLLRSIADLDEVLQSGGLALAVFLQKAPPHLIPEVEIGLGFG
jgi:hypothetical protein